MKKTENFSNTEPKKNLTMQSQEKSNCLAEVEISYKTKVKPSERVQIKTSKVAQEVLRGCYDAKTLEHSESFLMLVLNRANKVMGWFKVSQGGINSCLVDIRVIMQVAINSNASGIIISHNHPSGALHPSAEDINITKKIKEACRIMEISLLDHIIITEESYYSFGDEGTL